jgi:hypothetical protein
MAPSAGPCGAARAEADVPRCGTANAVRASARLTRYPVRFPRLRVPEVRAHAFQECIHRGTGAYRCAAHADVRRDQRPPAAHARSPGHQDRRAQRHRRRALPSPVGRRRAGLRRRHPGRPQGAAGRRHRCRQDRPGGQHLGQPRLPRTVHRQHRLRQPGRGRRVPDLRRGQRLPGLHQRHGHRRPHAGAWRDRLCAGGRWRDRQPGLREDHRAPQCARCHRTAVPRRDWPP